MTTHAEGTRAATASVAAHLRSLAGLERELALTELRRKGAMTAAGTAVAVAAVLLSFFVVALGLAAAVAALALVLDVWLALLFAFAALTLVVGVLLAIGRSLLRQRGPLLPEKAIEEARLTRDLLRGHRDR